MIWDLLLAALGSDCIRAHPMCFGLDLVCSGRELVQVLDVYLSWVVPARIIPVPVLFVPVARWRFSIRMISTKDVSTRANFLFCC